MPNQYVNKVQRVVDGETETIIDITSDTVSAESLAIGYTAHAANGAPIVGTLHVPPDMVVLSYGTSTWADFTNAYSTNSIVYCRASSNSNPATGTQNRMAAMAYVDDSASPAYVEFQYYYPIASHTAAQQGDQVFIYKLDSTSSWTVAVQDIYTLPTMSATTKGGAKLGAGLSVADDTLSLSGESYTSAEKTKLAGIEANANNYTLPTMGASTKGGAKVGDGLSVSNDVLSVDVSDVESGQLPIAHGGTGAATASGARDNLGVLEYSSGVFNVGGTSAYLLFKTTAIASFSPPTGVSACMVLDTSDNGLYWYTS